MARRRQLRNYNELDGGALELLQLTASAAQSKMAALAAFIFF